MGQVHLGYELIFGHLSNLTSGVVFLNWDNLIHLDIIGTKIGQSTVYVIGIRRQLEAQKYT